MLRGAVKMRKTIRKAIPCPHCGQEIRFNEPNLAYLLKTNSKVWDKRLEKKLEARSVITCPYKNCRKAMAMIVTPRKIRLSKRVSKVERTLSELLETAEEIEEE